jgi:hypothetical protein
MAVKSATILVGTTPTLLVKADHDGCRVLVHKQQNHVIYLGASNVTTSTGYLFDHDATIELLLQPGDTLYGIVTGPGTQTAYVLTVGNV